LRPTRVEALWRERRRKQQKLREGGNDERHRKKLLWRQGRPKEVRIAFVAGEREREQGKGRDS
jgi:hypothetical protein